MSFDSKRMIGPAQLAALALTLVYAAAAFVVFDPTSLLTLDVAVKWLQAKSLVASGFTSVAMPPPGGTLDPAGEFLPFVPPHVFYIGHDLHGIFPSSVALLNAIFAPWGLGGIAFVSVLSGGVVLVATSLIPEPRHRLGTVIVLGAATPLWFYSILPWEHAPALALSTSAVAIVCRTSGGPFIATAGVLAGLAALLRDEFFVIVPLVALLTAARRGWRHGVLVAALSAVPTVILGAIDAFVFNRPIAAHLVHAVRPLAAITAGGAAVPGMPHDWSLTTRLQVAIGDWLFGFEPAAWPLWFAVPLGVVALFAAARRRAPVVLIVVTMVMVLHLNDLATYLAEPAFVAGLFRLSPVLIFALLPMAPSHRSSVERRWSLAVSGAILLVALGTLNTDGGTQLGPRLLLPIFPFVALAAFEGLSSYRQAAVTADRLIWQLGVGLAFGSIVMQTAVAGRAYYDLNSTEQQPVAWLYASTEPVIVVDSTHTMSVAVHAAEGRSVVMAQNQEVANRLADVMAERHVATFAFVARERGPDPTFPGFTISNVQSTRFTRIVHWAACGSGGDRNHPTVHSPRCPPTL
jgi:hypothetical protein